MRTVEPGRGHAASAVEVKLGADVLAAQETAADIGLASGRNETSATPRPSGFGSFEFGPHSSVGNAIRDQAGGCRTQGDFAQNDSRRILYAWHIC